MVSDRANVNFIAIILSWTMRSSHTTLSREFEILTSLSDFNIIIKLIVNQFIFGAFLSSNKRKVYMYRCMSEISGNLVFWFFRNKNRSNIWVDWFFLPVRSRRLRTVNSKRSAKNWNINICNPNNRLTWSNKLEQPCYTFLYLSSSIFISAQEVQILVS